MIENGPVHFILMPRIPPAPAPCLNDLVATGLPIWVYKVRTDPRSISTYAGCRHIRDFRMCGESRVHPTKLPVSVVLTSQCPLIPKAGKSGTPGQLSAFNLGRPENPCVLPAESVKRPTITPSALIPVPSVKLAPGSRKTCSCHCSTRNRARCQKLSVYIPATEFQTLPPRQT